MGAFEQAIQACRNDLKLAGVGFVFTVDDPFCGVDLDDSISSDNGQLKPWAKSIVNQMDSYTEISPSSCGVKVFLKGCKPGNRCRKAYHDGEVEIYDRDRFFTLTGLRLPEASAVVEERHDALNALYREIFGTDDDISVIPTLPSHGGNGHVNLDDDEIICLASRQRRSGEKFAALWAGRWKEHFNSPSEANSSVIFTLAFYSKDPAQLVAIPAFPVSPFVPPWLTFLQLGVC